MRIELDIERDGEELTVTVGGSWYRADPDVGLGASVEVEDVQLDGKPWGGQLTEAEERRAEEALFEAHDDAEEGYWADFDDHCDDD